MRLRVRRGENALRRMKKSDIIGRRKPLSVKRVQAHFDRAFHALRMYTYAIWGV